ncbi:hypothetical protein BC834DRAFT_109180 [Gloeopeniophorella convolvens]|nr:hypothetical protein BC834DRAFT_109180 [Gloeopeniophorella convolvens]
MPPSWREEHLTWCPSGHQEGYNTDEALSQLVDLCSGIGANCEEFSSRGTNVSAMSQSLSFLPHGEVNSNRTFLEDMLIRRALHRGIIEPPVLPLIAVADYVRGDAGSMFVSPIHRIGHGTMQSNAQNSKNTCVTVRTMNGTGASACPLRHPNIRDWWDRE